MDDNFNQTQYQYDALSRRTRTTYADTKYVQYSYDDASNLSGWTDQNATVVSNTHDAVNRLTARSVTRGTGVLGTTSETYTYDALNRLLTAVDDDFQVELTRDSVGNLLQDRQGYLSLLGWDARANERGTRQCCGRERSTRPVRPGRRMPVALGPTPMQGS